MGFQTPQFFLLTAAGFCLFWAVKGRKLLVLAVFDCLFYLYAGLLDFGLFFGASVLSYVSSQGMRGRYRKAFFAFGLGINLLRVTDAKDLGPLLAKMLTFSAPGVGPHFVQYGSLVAGLCGLHLAEYLAYKHGSRLWEWWNQCVPRPARSSIFSSRRGEGSA